jgi:NADH:ubiquinone oxidoreductase subunit
MKGQVDQRGHAAYIRRMNIGTRLFTMLHGRRIGRDAEGNIYYEARRAPRDGARQRRWVAYNGLVEPTRVPAEWHAWLHYTTEAPIPDGMRRPWQKPHVMNLTGTPAGYRPPGHDYRGGHRAAAAGDYEAWTPGS